MSKIPVEYFRNNDTLWLARDLIGKHLLYRDSNGIVRGGIITETEAYLGANDRASHAWGNRKTKRTSTMFLPGGVAYVYLCYGIHHLLNIVTAERDIPHAILIRGIYAITETHIRNQHAKNTFSAWLDGPGKLTKALGITTALDKTPLTGDTLWLEPSRVEIPDNVISITPRIGVDYAGEDALLPYRFCISTPKAFENLLNK